MACTEHYQPRFAGDALPATPTGTAIALADKLETLAGIWGIGLQPTGDRDPFALRRHALGILRILIEKKLPLSLRKMLAEAVGILSTNASMSDPTEGVLAFFMDRLRGMLRDRGYLPTEIEAVLAQNPDRFDNLIDRLEAVRTFAAMPESASLAAANKRITNILKKSDINAGDVHADILVEDSEKKLFADMKTVKPEADRKFAIRRLYWYTKNIGPIARRCGRFLHRRHGHGRRHAPAQQPHRPAEAIARHDEPGSRHLETCILNRRNWR